MSKRTAEETAYTFEDEVFFQLRSQRNRWMLVALLALTMAVVCMVAVLSLLPLKEIRPYVVMVDKTTGAAEKVVQVRPVSLAEQEAVRQAELVSYVTDRETYDIADNETRIPDVLTRSEEQARSSLVALWTRGNENYPPNIYTTRSRLSVEIISITLLTEGTAQVRFRKSLETEGEQPIVRDFVATVGFAFQPKVERNLQAVWKNPFGFIVTNYRVDAETLSPRKQTNGTDREALQ
ncbi:virB8 family protein [Ahrensia marina]|uniref:virB8 family protein n=1 Tax=Ahrensia marina TaxID=1514904 RepID=UPI0006B5BE40|nr:type IV secretion system protein [Ahrensia marina]